MKENLVSLAKLLATDDAFNLAFSSRGTDEEKYELAKTKFTDLTREDFSEFLKKLREAEKANLAELSPDELKMVAGGAGRWSTKLAAATMLVTTLGSAGVISQRTDAMDGHGTDAARLPLLRQLRYDGNSLYDIRLGPPRNLLNLDASATGTAISTAITFNHGTKSAQEILKEHHERNKAYGSSSLIGELAQIVESHIRLTGESITLGDINFHYGPLQRPKEKAWVEKEPSELLAAAGTYNSIITNMFKNGVATKDTAIKILNNLSKPCSNPSQEACQISFNTVRTEDITTLSDQLFDDLEGDHYKPARQLVAVLLCECIRFNDDGALVRWAMRNVIRLFDDGNNGAFERVFKTDDDNPLPLAIFARAASAELSTYGGKQQTLALILNDIPVSYVASLVHYDHPKFKNLLNGFNAECLEDTGEFISGIEQSRMEEEPVDKAEDNDGEEDISYIPSADQSGLPTN